MIYVTVGQSILLHSLVCWEGVDKFVNIPTRRRYALRTLKACDIGNVKGYCKKCIVDFLYACKTSYFELILFLFVFYILFLF